MTFERLQQIALQLSNQERCDLWLSCPSAHPDNVLTDLDAITTYGPLRYCEKCFVAFAGHHAIYAPDCPPRA